MSALGRRRIRVPIDTSKFDSPQDILTKSALRAWNGSPAQIEIGLFYGATLITDLSLLTELTIQIKAVGTNNSAPAETAPVLASKTVTVFDDTLTTSTWDDGTKQHAVFSFTSAELKLGPATYWFEIVGSITGEPEPITYAAGTLQLTGDGYENGAGAAPDPAASYLNTEQSDARYAQGGDFAFVAAPASKTDLTTLPGSVAPASGKTYLAIGPTGLWTIRNPETEWRFTDRATI
ncbi:MAG: hypothetical protein Fur0032_21020 [Terrimicrobiaceae bacterium]